MYLRVARVFLGLGLVLLPFAALSQAYPAKPIRVVVGAAAGNTQELPVRLVSEAFQTSMGQPLVIENFAGGGGLVAAETAYKAAADGYTIMIANVGHLSVNPFVFRSLPYDADKFVPITQFFTDQYLFAVHPSVPAQTLAEFVAYAKANKGKTTFAASQLGAPGHFAGVMLNLAAGIDMETVAYKGVPPAVTDVLAGRVNAIFATAGAIGSYVRAGKLRALAVTSERRIANFPDVPTFAEGGVNGVVAYLWAGLVAPPGTPGAIANRLSTEFQRLIMQPEVVAKMRGADQEPKVNSPREFGEFLKADRERWGAAVKASGFKLDQ
jgi:tripartite-type tricarboxylate transporter receptor subunit TctC